MEHLLTGMTEALSSRLGDALASLYLYGSAAVGDFHPGWSDIDVLCLTDRPLPEAAAASLVTLRQELVETTGEPGYRSFEGAVTSLPEFLSGRYARVVYWGTSGERLTSTYDFDAFSRVSLLRYGKLLAGRETRQMMMPPSMAELRDAVARHLAGIRRCAAETGPTLYSAGWLLDIARCLYTLRTGDILPKTEAGAWALREGLCPVPEALERALTIRRNPMVYRDDPATLAWLSRLGPDVQRFADVLEAALRDGLDAVVVRI